MSPKLLLTVSIASLVLAACASAPPPNARPVVTQGPVRASGASSVPNPVSTPSMPSPPVCADCGIVAHIETIAGGKGSGTVLGGIVGSVAGKPVGNEPSYNIHIRMDDGRDVTLRQDEIDGVRQGQRVRVVGGRLATP